MSIMRNCNLLLVDDDPFILDGIGEDLEGKGYQVTRADSGDAAVRLLEKRRFDLVITDLVMDQTDGIQVLKKTKEKNSETMVIILTGYGDMKSAIDALRNHADDYMLKPCESAEMVFRINRCLEKAELSRKLKFYQQILPMCCVCKKVRTSNRNEVDRQKWISVEKFIHDKAQVDITSSYCPDCAKKTMDEFTKKH
jgi:DNA-binding response OmpR family regulator